MKWTAEMDELLIHYRAEGLSSSEIVRILNRKFRTELTRNAVIGRAVRLKLPDRRAVTRAARRKLSSIRAFGFEIKPKKESLESQGGSKTPGLKTEALPLPRADDIPTKTLMDLEPGDCRWRVDKPLGADPYGFCAKEALPGLTFCEGHARRAYANWPEVKHKYVEVKEKAKEAEPA